MIRILIADDQALVRGGLRMILDSQADLEVVGEAADGREALALAGELAPDLVLMDVRMPSLDGLDATRRLLGGSADAPKVVVLTTFDSDEYLYDAIRAGASGFLLKSAPPETLVQGVRAVMAGDALLDREITRRLLERFVHRAPPGRAAPEIEDLTPREREVLRLIGEGRSNAEIATDLFLSETTVKTHVNHILTKLRLRDRVQAVALAYRAGLMDDVS
jgi:DNA-binding NarL/FixJ family response regulator